MDRRRPPALTDAQRLAALELANRARKARREAARRLKSGEAGVADAISAGRSGDPVWGGMRLYGFCRSCPGVGDASARAVLRALGLAERRRLRSLGPVQAATLAEMLYEVGRKRCLTAEILERCARARVRAAR